MENSGRMCCGATCRKRAKEATRGAKSIDEIVKKLNKAHLGGGRLKLKNKHTIAGGYDQCYCGQVKHTKTPFPRLTYCHCSVGWYKQLFETVLGRPVDVEITQSIISLSPPVVVFHLYLEEPILRFLSGNYLFPLK